MRCNLCSIEYTPVGKNQKYCGSKKFKTGCSWENNKKLSSIRANRSRKLSRRKIRLTRKCKLCEVNIGILNFRAKYCKQCSSKQNSKGAKIRYMVLVRDNYTCQYCGRKAPEVVLEIDHKIPKSKGGKNTEDNLVVSCRECNRGKGNI